MRPSLMGLAVLGLLSGGPLHPYRMQRLMKEWGKDQVVNVGQRANLYKTIKRLNEAGLIAVQQTERDQRYPERTVYELTDAGGQTLRAWLTDMLSTPRNEYPAFPAALSFLMLMAPAEARVVLERRAAVLEESMAALDRDLQQYSEALPRVTVLETEYQRAVTGAELAWVNGAVDDLRTGRLTWSEDDFSTAGQGYLLE
jgi:DNA-binding PadR family transcriptional regulator